MKYILITYGMEGAPIFKKLQDDGYEVIVGQVQEKADLLVKGEKLSEEEPEEKKRRLSIYDGLFDDKRTADEVVKYMKTIKDPWNYFVFHDMNNLFKFAQQTQDLGFNGNFPTEADATMETDRDKAKAFVKKFYPKLKVAETEEFQNTKDGIAFIEDSEDVWVLKAKGDEGRTVVPSSDDPEIAGHQIIDALTTDEKDYNKGGFILERKIPNMIELTPQKIYYNGLPVYTSLDIELKPMGAGNTGPMCGCAADLVFPTDMDDKINQMAFPPVVDELAKMHKGMFVWDASLLFNPETGDAYFGEFCSNRVGYSSFYNEVAQAPDINSYFESIVSGRQPISEGMFGTSVRLFNLHKDSTYRVMRDAAVAYMGNDTDCFMSDIYCNENGLATVGSDWELATITGQGIDLYKAAEMAYHNVGRFSLEGVYYRPLHDYLSYGYTASVVNRFNYAVENGLISIEKD